MRDRNHIYLFIGRIAPGLDPYPAADSKSIGVPKETGLNR